MKSPTQLNKLINRIKSEGWTYPTEYAYISDAFARIVIPSGRKGAGTIRTMNQANDYLTKNTVLKLFYLREKNMTKS